LEALWQGNWAYCAPTHGIDVMFAALHFPVTSPMRMRWRLSFLNQAAAADADWKVRAVAGRGLSLT